MTSITLTLSGNSSQLQAQYFPSIDLSDGNYVCGLIDFQTFNSIPNVDDSNNLFYFGHENLQNEQHNTTNDKNIDQISLDLKMINSNEIDNDWYFYDVEPGDHDGGKAQKDRKSRSYNTVKQKQPLSCLQIPTGSYEVEHLSRCLKRSLAHSNVKFELEANKNTLQCEIICSQPIDFCKPNTIGQLLGFRSNKVLQENKVHVSQLPADILKISVIRVECNVIAGSYLNNHPSHTIHEFSPRVPPGYKIIEVPQNVIYFPVTVKYIHALNLSIVDQNNRPINFRGETITIRLHIKKIISK